MQPSPWCVGARLNLLAVPKCLTKAREGRRPGRCTRKKPGNPTGTKFSMRRGALVRLNPEVEGARRAERASLRLPLGSKADRFRYRAQQSRRNSERDFSRRETASKKYSANLSPRLRQELSGCTSHSYTYSAVIPAERQDSTEKGSKAGEPCRWRGTDMASARTTRRNSFWLRG